jgi:hypothetical protein
MPRFTGIPDIPQGNIDEWQYRVLDTMKQNVELLAGIRNEEDGASAAVLRSSITTKAPPAANFQGLSAQGSGFTISNVQVASLNDHIALIRDFQLLAQDVANLRAVVTTLVNQLRGS